MVDSVSVFPPGFRVTDQSGAVVPGAQIVFKNAGTETPRTVYSNSGLSTTLETVVTCDAYGAPISSGGSNVLIYTGTTAYKVQFLTSTGALIPGMSFDNVLGALDTSTFGLTATTTFPVVSVSSTGVIATLSRVENVNPTAGQVTRTLPTAASAGNGAFIIIRHDGTANAVLIVAQGSDTIKMRGDLGSQQTLQLYTKGDAVFLHCDGVDWHANYSPAHNRGRFWQIKAIQTAPPGSAVTGDSYLITGTPTGAWSTFAADDIVTSNGSNGWIRSRPFTDCGWLVYNAATSLFSTYVGSAWVSATITAATQSDQVTGTSTALAVTPGRQQFHASAAKVWVSFTAATGAILASYNVSSVTRSGAGAYVVNYTTAFSTANYAAITSCLVASGVWAYATAQTTTSVSLGAQNTTAAADPTRMYVACYGAQ